MAHRLEVHADNIWRIVMLLIMIVVGPQSTMPLVHGQEQASSQRIAKTPTPPEWRKVADPTYDVDQIHAQLTFLSVPTELVEATITDWSLAPLDLADLAAADPFAGMSQPLQVPRSQSDDTPRGHIAAGTEARLPCTHKVLNDQQAQELLNQLQEDERTESVFSPQLVFIDGMTATAAVGEKRPFVVGWKDDLPQTRVVPQGKMVRLRTVLDNERMWLDYEIVLSRILDVATRSIRIANRPQPVKLAVPHVQTTRATANVELPAGGTLLIGGLPAESREGVPHQLVVLVRAGRMKPIRMKKVPDPGQETIEPRTAATIQTPPVPAEPVRAINVPTAPPRRNPFSLISRMLNRPVQQAAASPEAPKPQVGRE